MQILTLELMDFGQFHNKTVVFNDGLNIIYGDNEAGKSTIWYFIVGMFYGFYKPYMKRKVLLPEYDKYKPWRGGGYRGAMVIFDEKMGMTLRILRNFEGSQEIKVYNQKTGEEVTPLYETHPIYKLPDVAGKHLNMSYTRFINTLGIQQLGHRTDDDLHLELQNTVVNALSTKQLDISMEKVFKKLREKQDEIGSNRKKRSIFAMKTEYIHTLETERLQGLNVIDDVKQLNASKEVVNKQRQDIKRIENLLDIRKQQAKSYENRKIYVRARAIKEQLFILEESMDKLGYDHYFTLEQLCQGKDSYKQCEQLNKNCQEYDTRLNRLKVDILKVTTELKDLKKEEINKRNHLSKKVFVSLAFLVVLGVALLFWKPFIGWACIGIAFLVTLVELIALKVQHMEYSVFYKSKMQLVEAKENQLKVLEQQQQEENQLLEFAKKQVKNLEIDFLDISHRYAIQTSADFERLLSKADQFKECRFEYNSLNKLLLDSLGHLSYDQLEESTKKTLDLPDEEILDREIVTLDQEVKQKTVDLEKKLSALNTREKELLRGRRTLAEIDEELELEKINLEKLSYQLKVYKKVEDTLLAIMEELQHEFAPVLNEQMSRMIEKLTQGKYKEVKVNPDMLMRLTDPNSGETVTVDRLSQGTMDVFYLALRYGLMNWLNDNSDLPLILDEILAHLDDSRLTSAMMYLSQLPHQILLFTCHQREIERLPEGKGHIVYLT